MSDRITFDSQVYTYLLQVTEEGYDPNHDPDGEELASERVATLRVFLYGDVSVLLPTVVEEYEQITHAEWRRLHEHWRAIFFVSRPLDPKKVEALAGYYFRLHGRNERERMDCRIVAEAELTRVDYLLTYDSDLIKDMHLRSDYVSLVPPSHFWAQMNLPRGARPRMTPSPGNPLNDVDWWKWE